MLRGYVRLFFFAAGLLFGIQLPAFVIQYVQRIDAHYLEVKQNFAGFQRTADRHFGGDVAAMIRHHEQSGDAVFIEGGENIREIWQRLQHFTAERTALEAPLHWQLWHVLREGDREIIQETRNAYNYTVPLDLDAIIYGLIIGLLVALIYDLFVTLLRFAFFPNSQRR